VDRATFINADHQPNKIADLGDPGFRLQFTNLLHPSIIEAVGWHWVTPLLEWFRETNSIGEFVPTNYSFVKVSGS
jgi:hypothetical protein